MGSAPASKLLRHLDVVGTYNFRDVGGYASRSGLAVRWRTLYRADSLHRLSALAQQELVEAGLSTVIDLRKPSEIDHAPGVFATNPSVRYVNVFLNPGGADAAREVPEAERFNLSSLYRRMIDSVGDGLKEVFLLLSEPGVLPAVIHCTAGKDRTGVIVAVLLDALGVSWTDICADYALSAEYLTGNYFVEARERAERAGIPWAQYRLLLDSPAEAMMSLLNYVRAEYGGSRSYLQSVGVDMPSLQRLQDALLEQPIDEKELK